MKTGVGEGFSPILPFPFPTRKNTKNLKTRSEEVKFFLNHLHLSAKLTLGGALGGLRASLLYAEAVSHPARLHRPLLKIYWTSEYEQKGCVALPRVQLQDAPADPIREKHPRNPLTKSKSSSSTPCLKRATITHLA